MKTYPRFKIYELFTKQEHKCGSCAKVISMHDLEVENIIEDKLSCFSCLSQKKKAVSDCDNKSSIIEMDLRPLYTISSPCWNIKDEEFKFKSSPLFVEQDLSYTEQAHEQSEDEMDAESEIESSWYHRAILGDEGRQIYDDGLHTDFEEVEAYWAERHEYEEEYIDEQNVQILQNMY